MKFQHLGQTWTLFQRNTRPGAPYYFAPRWGDRKQKVFHCLRDKTTALPLTLPAATAAAKDLITAHFKGPDQYQALRDQTKLRDTTTVTGILEAWAQSGYAEPNGRGRPQAQADRHAEVLKYPKQWFADKTIAQVNEPLLVKYAHWRRGQVREGFAGDRITDRELNTCCQCFYWATAAGLADRNPFIDRPKFQGSATVRHASAYMPASDDELHRLTGWLIATGDPANVLAAAQLMFMALTGLRPGEPGFLRWNAQYTDAGPEHGHRFERTIDGAKAELLAIKRLKGGINPAVVVRPALARFLAAWQPYCRRTWPDAEHWFPHPTDKTRPLVMPEDTGDPLNYRLQLACEALGLPKRKAHAMRAFYVRVRRSEGASDSTIAEELGQGSGPALIVTTYGAADQIRGDTRFDWLPSAEKDGPQIPIAWTLLEGTRTNIIAL